MTKIFRGNCKIEITHNSRIFSQFTKTIKYINVISACLICQISY
ncbi:hypothetical protein P245_12320 [Comamonas thiooxydans]|uniref:Uncharacterized protein n=1 Tax=Comamonas thiooxydans TaxID=363952 RepID=A0A0E3BKS0_9BURK|nr:hypothetical protein P245_12320 [Comamonas thiooxydans]